MNNVHTAIMTMRKLPDHCIVDCGSGRDCEDGEDHVCQTEKDGRWERSLAKHMAETRHFR